MQFGLDLLGSPLYPKAAVSAALKCPWITYIRGFSKTFGDFMPVAIRAANKNINIGVQLIWDDNHNYGNHNIPILKKEAKRWQEFKIRNPYSRVELSTFCEHRLSNPDKYHDIISDLAPNCLIVNTPMQGGAFSKKYKNEVHGTKSAPLSGDYNYSLDGGIPDPHNPSEYFDCTDVDIEALKKKHSRAEIFWLWHSWFNLRWSSEDKRSRAVRIAEKSKPNKRFIHSIAHLALDRMPNTLPPLWLAKSHADRSDQTSLRASKLLIISPVKAPEILLKRAGKVIGRLPYYGTFEGGLYRYYAPKYGFEYGRKAQVCIGSKSYGSIDCGFRGPSYRGLTMASDIMGMSQC